VNYLDTVRTTHHRDTPHVGRCTKWNDSHCITNGLKQKLLSTTQTDTGNGELRDDGDG